MLRPLAGSKVTLVVVTVLVVGLISFFTIRYIQSAEEDKIIKEIQQEQIEKRKRIDEGVRSAPDTPTDSLQYLRDRQGGK